MCPFECDVCIFRKLTGRSSDNESSVDDLLLATIRRMNLDAFWSSESVTVLGNKGKINMSLKLSALVGLQGPYLHDGPFPAYDHCGYEVAIQMLLYSKRKGRTNKSHLQFDTIWKVRTSYANQIRASPQMNRKTLSMGDMRGNYQRLTLNPCASMWFGKFVKGCKNRMGQEWKPNKGMSTELLLTVLEEAERRIEAAPTASELHRWSAFHCYAVVTYVLSLRGREGLLLDLEGLHKHWTSDEIGHVIVTIQGRVKGETGDRDHLLPAVFVTLTGISVRSTLERLLAL